MLTDKSQQAGTKQLVNFKINDEEYAFDIMSVNEIIKITKIKLVPKAPSYIKGVISLRNKILPIIELRKILSIANEDEHIPLAKQKIIVIKMGNISFGVLVDSVSHVFSIQDSSIELPPQILDDKKSEAVSAIGKINNGEKIFMILDPEKIMGINTSLIEELNKEQEIKIDEDINNQINLKNNNERSEESLIVCFKLDDEEYGINVLEVQEIIKPRSITQVPQKNKTLEGIINLRGGIIPIMDLRNRLNIDESKTLKNQRIIIVMTQNGPTGLVVDEVTEVTRISSNEIEPPPSSLVYERDHFLNGIGKLNNGKRVILLFNTLKLLGNNEKNCA